MKSKEIIYATLIFLTITGVFFYKFFLFGRIPFPGDLLISQYKPWQTYSYIGYNPGSYPQKAQYFDAIRQLYPWKTAVISDIKHGYFPLWNPFNFSGSPLFANLQSAVLYPLNVFYLFLSQPIAWSITVMLQSFLASLGMYLFARRIKIGVKGSLMAAITYAYCLFSTTFLEYNTINQVTLWLPYLLYASENLLSSYSVKSIIIFLLACVCAAFAGHLQLYGYIMAFAAVYIGVRLITTRTPEKSRFIFFPILFVLGIAITAVQLFPTLELVGLAARVSQEYTFLIEKLLIQPYQLILYFVPDIFGNPATNNYLLASSYPSKAVYVGIVPLLFAFLSLKQFRKNPFITFFSLTALATLLCIVRTPISEILYKIPLPFISSASPSNMIFITSFSLAILAGFGVDAWQTRSSKVAMKFFVTVICIAIALVGILKIGHYPIQIKNLIYSVGIFGVALVLFYAGNFVKRGKSYLVLLLLILSMADSFYLFTKFNPFVPKQIVFPDAQIFSWLKNNAGYNRFWGYGSASIEANFATQYGLFSPDGYDPLYPKNYGQLIASSREGKVLEQFTNSTRSDALIAPGYGPTDFPINMYRQKILDLLGVRYILDRTENRDTEETFPPKTYTMVYNENDWKIFANGNALPRAFFTNEYKKYSNDQEFESMFFNPTFHAGQTLLVKNDIPFTQAPLAATGTATIRSYAPEHITIDTVTPSEQILFLSDTYYPGWRASVDGRETPIYPADMAFRAIVVPQGRHIVTFSYEPVTFSLGWKTSMIGLLASVGFIIVIKRKTA